MNFPQPVYYNRDFTNRGNTNAKQMVDSLSWNCIGGCDQASISAVGPAAGIWEFAEYLRYPVEVYDDKARAVWYGYVNDVQISYGALNWGVSLESMANSLSVAYTYNEAQSTDVGIRKTTTWYADADSVGAFGTIQKRLSAVGMTDAAAVYARNTALEQMKYPSGVVTATGIGGGDPGMAVASIHCLGWYSTLDWVFAPAAGTALTDSIDQIYALSNEYGQFITGFDYDAYASVTSNPTRDGDRTALVEINALLKMGNSSGKRLLATVSRDRRLQIRAEPANTTIGAQIDRLGYLYDTTGRKATPYNPPYGVWCQLRDVLPSSVDTSRMINPTLQFIEAVEWSANMGLVPKFRGQQGLEETLGVY